MKRLFIFSFAALLLVACNKKDNSQNNTIDTAVEQEVPETVENETEGPAEGREIGNKYMPSRDAQRRSGLY